MWTENPSPVSPFAPRGIVKLRITASDVPPLVTTTELPAAPVVTVPTVIVAGDPVSPFLPNAVHTEPSAGAVPVVGETPMWSHHESLYFQHSKKLHAVVALYVPLNTGLTFHALIVPMCYSPSIFMLFCPVVMMTSPSSLMVIPSSPASPKYSTIKLAFLSILNLPKLYGM